MNRLQKALFVIYVVLAFVFTGLTLYTQDQRNSHDRPEMRRSAVAQRINWFINMLPWAYSGVQGLSILVPNLPLYRACVILWQIINLTVLAALVALALFFHYTEADDLETTRANALQVMIFWGITALFCMTWAIIALSKSRRTDTAIADTKDIVHSREEDIQAILRICSTSETPRVAADFECAICLGND